MDRKGAGVRYIPSILGSIAALDVAAFALGKLGHIGTTRHAWHCVIFTTGMEFLLLGLAISAVAFGVFIEENVG